MKLSICKLVSMARQVSLLGILCAVFWTSAVIALPNNANTSADPAQQSISDLPILRVGVLQFGTINWEMDTIIHHQLDTQRGFRLSVHPFASKNASAVALQSGAVDVIMTDLFWVSRQRGQGKPYVIMPTTKASGGVYTSEEQSFTQLLQQNDNSIGVAGGSVDKNWLLLQAYAKQQELDLFAHFTPKFAAPPLLNRFMMNNELDASINFWHYNARLDAAGFSLTLPVTTMLKSLKIHADVPLLGWVFDEHWAKNQSSLITAFVNASFSAKAILTSQAAEWVRIRDLTKAENEQVFTSLQNNYPDTLLTQFTIQEIAATQQLFAVFAEVGGQELMGTTTEFNANIYWSDALRIWQSQQ
ncbi:MAG: ABC transporter substrate-binding protein [Glaciecola sp.]|nr:ABC transporter substrate-binding protein [Glaciecola sp.]MDG1922554.1 ABC transporter substrate-binding protein [Glaciecola sp.]